MCTGVIHLVVEGKPDVARSAAAAHAARPVKFEHTQELSDERTRGHAGTVVANKNFYKDTSGNILNEICECDAWPACLPAST